MAQLTGGFKLWIDGVGAWLVCLGSEITIGGPGRESKEADICLMANISRRHATITRSGETWAIEPHADTKIGERPLHQKAQLRAESRITMSNRVVLGFRVPTALSSTAVLDFESDHRPPQSIDGIVLADKNVLLGPGRENHIVCSHWQDSVVLFRRNEQWMCRSKMNLAVDGDIVTEPHEVKAGTVIANDDLRLRIEAV